MPQSGHPAAVMVLSGRIIVSQLAFPPLWQTPLKSDKPGWSIVARLAHRCVVALQTGESWNRTVRPKAIGAWNADAASRGLPALEHFIFFSSVVAVQGNAGRPTQPSQALQPHAVSSGV